MKATRVMFLMLLVVLCGTLAQADYRDGNDLLEEAIEYKNGRSGQQYVIAKSNTFIGYTTGLIDGVNASSSYIEHVPNQVTNGQFADIFAKYLVEHPESRHEGGSILFYRAVIEAFPPPKK